MAEAFRFPPSPSFQLCAQILLPAYPDDRKSRAFRVGDTRRCLLAMYVLCRRRFILSLEGTMGSHFSAASAFASWTSTFSVFFFPDVPHPHRRECSSAEVEESFATASYRDPGATTDLIHPLPSRVSAHSIFSVISGQPLALHLPFFTSAARASMTSYGAHLRARSPALNGPCPTPHLYFIPPPLK